MRIPVGCSDALTVALNHVSLTSAQDVLSGSLVPQQGDPILKPEVTKQPTSTAIPKPLSVETQSIPAIALPLLDKSNRQLSTSHPMLDSLLSTSEATPAATDSTRGDAGLYVAENDRDAMAIQKLSQTIKQVDFEEEPLSSLVTWLYENFGLTMVLDVEGNLQTETPITFKIENISLRTFLEMVLEAHDSTFCVRDGLIYVSSNDAPLCATRVFSISSKLRAELEDAELIELARSAAGSDSWSNHTNLKMVGSLLIAQHTEPQLYKIGRLMDELEAKLTTENR